MIRGRAPRRVTDTTEYERLKRRAAWAALALCAVTVVGVIGFYFIGRGEHDLVDAVYMTIITLSTVGFGEVIDMSGNPAGRVFTLMLLLLGLGIVLYTVPLLAAFVIEGQLSHVFARRRMQKNISRLDGHTVVCGDGAVARCVLEELVRTERPAVLVCPTAEAAASVLEGLGDVPHLADDPSTDQTLEDAGVDRAMGLVACMENDNDNILIVLTARRLSPDLRIIAAADRREANPKLRTAGADGVVSPSRIGGLRMASELVRPSVVSFLDEMLRDPRSSLRVEELRVPDDSQVIGEVLSSLEIDAVPGTLLLALRRASDGTFEFKPNPNHRIDAGLTLVLMTDARGLAAVEGRIR